MNKPISVSGLILAGGEGRRVQGRDKGLLHWRGQPLVAHVARRLAPQVDQLVLSCNRNAERYAPYADTLVEDSRPDFQGPLAGIEAATRVIRGDYLVVAACDTPELPMDLVQRLLQAIHAAEVAISYAHDGVREQYLSAALATATLKSLPAYLESGQRSVRHWYQLHPTTRVDFSDSAAAFVNHNTLEIKKPAD